MKCPYCMETKTKTINSRPSNDGKVVLRRRECLICGKRFSTYEKREDILPMVIKKDGRREPFNREKIIAGVCLACRRLPISMSNIEDFVDSLEVYFQEIGKKEVHTYEIGDRVVNELREWDYIAYIRFLSVYKEFKDIKEMAEEIKKILKYEQERSI